MVVVPQTRRSLVQGLVRKLVDKAAAAADNVEFSLHRVLQAHVLPLTNCAFDKAGMRFITGSYDRTCKVVGAGSTHALCVCARILWSCRCQFGSGRAMSRSGTLHSVRRFTRSRDTRTLCTLSPSTTRMATSSPLAALTRHASCGMPRLDIASRRCEGTRLKLSASPSILQEHYSQQVRLLKSSGRPFTQSPLRVRLPRLHGLQRQALARPRCEAAVQPAGALCRNRQPGLQLGRRHVDHRVV